MLTERTFQEECKTSTTCGMAVWRWRWSYHAANIHRPVSCLNSGKKTGWWVYEMFRQGKWVHLMKHSLPIQHRVTNNFFCYAVLGEVPCRSTSRCSWVCSRWEWKPNWKGISQSEIKRFWFPNYKVRRILEDITPRHLQTRGMSPVQVNVIIRVIFYKRLEMLALLCFHLYCNSGLYKIHTHF